MFKKITLFLIIIYRRFISPLKAPTCRFYPTCSDYAFQAIDKYGLGKGLTMSIRRLCRCHPYHPGGYDPVE